MSQIFELCDVAKQNGKDGKPCWLIIKGAVYDVTKFLDDHPGGADLLLEYGGKDATKAFNAAGHSSDAVKDLKVYKIGEVAITCAKAAEAAASAQAPPLNEKNCCSAEEPKKSGWFCCC